MKASICSEELTEALTYWKLLKVEDHALPDTFSVYYFEQVPEKPINVYNIVT